MISYLFKMYRFTLERGSLLTEFPWEGGTPGFLLEFKESAASLAGYLSFITSPGESRGVLTQTIWKLSFGFEACCCLCLFETEEAMGDEERKAGL